MYKFSLDEVKGRKNYYRNNFRRGVKLLSLSLVVNATFIVLIAFFYLTIKEPSYYATNSASSILALNVMFKPNMSSTALLKPDLPEETSIKNVTR